MDLEGRAADIGAVHETRRDAKIFADGQRHQAAWPRHPPDARRKKAIDIRHPEPGIIQRGAGHLGLGLQNGFA